MFHINSVFKRASYRKFGAFSLVEVLMTLLIISIVIIAAAPVITKKSGVIGKYGETRHEGIVYTYNGNDIEQDSSTKCLVYTESGATKEYKPTNECSEYEFNVPEGVTSVNLTLVAGGGGGGGASGGLLVQNKVSGTSGTYFNRSLDMSKLKSFKVIHLVGKGKDGNNFEAMEDRDNLNNTKRNIYTYSNQQVQIGTGRGGDSSYALHDYVVPENLYRTSYRNVLENNITRMFKATGQSGSSFDSKFIIGKASSSDAEYTITVNPDGLTCDNNGEDCTSIIPHQNIIEAVSGVRRNFFFDARISLPYRHGKNYGYLEGGAGGHLPYYSKYGAGGRGQALMCQKTIPFTECTKANSNDKKCLKLEDSYQYTDNKSSMVSEVVSNIESNPLYCYVPCKSSSCTTREPSQLEQAQLGSGGAFSATYVEEIAGNPGTGGAGGGVIRIKNFPVSSKYTYVVRVGKGGKKGAAGKYNYSTGIAGENGYSGVSSSIWQKTKGHNTETLLYLVTGGTGGAGGSVTSTTNSGNIASAKRNTSVVLTNSSNTTSEIKDLLDLIDKDKTEIYSETCSVNVTSTLSGITTRCVHYPILDYRNGTNISFEKPYSYLSYLDSEKTNTVKTMGGFSSFTKSAPTVEIKDKNYLTSFYYKTIVDGQFGYVGGLGGFSGLGTKAGCGGLFMGNVSGFDGNTTMPRYNAEGAKKMYVQRELTSSKTNYDMYDIKDYYDNCTSSTPNGQSSEFVLPDPEKQSLGQAGAGGGGGGYLMFKGAGAGGDGQDGYVMIDWRK